MKCPKCKYTSFPHLENCPKCGAGLAEQRAVLGVYALPPDPPDLMLAYQAVSPALTGRALPHSTSAPGVTLGQLDRVDLPAVKAPADVVELPALEERAPASPEMTLESLDLNGVEEVALSPEPTAELGDESVESIVPAGTPAGSPLVYDLELDEASDRLTLESLEDEAHLEDDDAADLEQEVEYTLEIEEDVEFEIDGLALEGDDEDTEDRQ
jgi:hypothetical protein